MPYVERREGAVVGLYANAQPGYAEEFLEEDDAEVVSFRSPPQPPPDLQPYQFWAMLEISGNASALDNYINSLEGVTKIVARAKLDKATSFRRDNELVEAARQAIGLTNEELDALWEAACQIS